MYETVGWITREEKPETAARPMDEKLFDAMFGGGAKA